MTTKADQNLLEDLQTAETFAKTKDGATFLDLYRGDCTFSGDGVWAKLSFERRLELANAIRLRR
jgi:hypothetical protein